MQGFNLQEKNRVGLKETKARSDALYDPFLLLQRASERLAEVQIHPRPLCYPGKRPSQALNN
jgi:hypothetical protein